VPKAGTYLRGLLFCPECSKFLNRDRSAALNIRFLFTQMQLLGCSMPTQFVARRRQKKPKRNHAS
jgi:transposase